MSHEQAERMIELLEQVLRRLPEPEPKRPPLTGEAALPRWSTNKTPFSRFDF